MRGADIWLRAADPVDAPEAAAIFLASRAEAMPYLPRLHDDDDVLAWMRAVVLREQDAFLGGFGQERPAGLAAFRAGCLDHLYVSPAAQRRGLGGRLLDAAKAANPDGLRLCVFQRNARARRFYEGRGFRLLTLRDGAENEEREPDAVYAWTPSTSPNKS